MAGKAHNRGRKSLTTRVVAALAMGAAAAVLVAGCSLPGAFPAVLDDPTPRGETPLTPDQVKQATDALISARDHLSAEAQASGVPDATASTPPSPAPANAASGTTRTAGADAKP